MYPYFNVFNRLIPSYGVMMMLGLVTASGIGLFRVRRAGLKWENALILIASGFGFALLGATLLHLTVTYSWQEIWAMLRTGEMFRGNRLGLVFYGGLIGCVPGVMLGKRIARVHLSEYVPAMVPCISVGHAFGRIGCFLAGCCYGIPYDGIFSVVYPDGQSGVPANQQLFPVQIVESLALFAIGGILLWYSSKRRPALRVVGLYLLLYALARFGLEHLRYDAVRGHWGVWSTSQWISVVLFVMGGAMWIAPLVRKKE